jgi:hypothetical protein
MHVTLVKSDPRAREKPCLRCGYSLRKIIDSKHCPECGLSIWLSLNSNDTLDWSNPAWLRRVALATWVLAAAQVVGIGAYALMCLDGYQHMQAMRSMFAKMMGATDPTTMPSYGMYPFHLALLGAATRVAAAIYLLIYNGALLLLAGDEGRYPDKWSAFRWACRITAGIGLLAGLIVLVGGGRGGGGGNGGEMIASIFRLSLLASAVATFAYLRKLAQRIPHSTLTRLCAIILLAPLVSFVKSVPLLGWWLAMEVLDILDYLPLLYLPVTAVLLVWFGLLLRRCAQSAAEGWAKETASDSSPTPV